MPINCYHLEAAIRPRLHRESRAANPIAKTAMSGSTQRDADGDFVMSVGQPVFEFIKAPKLEDWSQSAIVKWRKARTQYESRVRQRCVDSGESFARALASVKDSFDVKLLKVVSLYELQSTVEDVTEDQLVELIYDRTQNVTNEFVPDLDGFFSKNLKMDLREVDFDARVLKYYRDFSELIEQHGFGRLLSVGLPTDAQFEDRMKRRCKILLDNLEAQALRDDVQRYVKYECRSARKNDFELFRIIKERARTQHKYHVLSLAYKQKTERSGDKKVPVKDAKDATPRKNREQHEGSAREKLRMNDNPQAVRSRCSTAPTDGCLHCGGAHWLCECPSASEEDRRRALEKLRAQREGARVRSKAVRADNQQRAKIGDDTLKSLGIDVDRQLEQLTSGYLMADEDPFKIEETTTNGIVQHQLDAMLADAKLMSLLLILVKTPAKVEPLKITLKPDAVPFRAKSCKYAPAQREFLRRELKRLEDLGYIRKNNHSGWACAAVPVAKPGNPMEFRLTIDYRPVNRQTVPIAGAVPNIDNCNSVSCWSLWVLGVRLAERIFSVPAA
ncbi:hypothetical protein ON010_g5753 [Phytophthora cinnamomi]|nr:hypothetical protein ON010_g5753 [Phytophthora cinnamomi]